MRSCTNCMIRHVKFQNWSIGDAAMTMQNPYWVNYRNLRENKKDRYMLSASLNYKILDWLTVSGRVSLDNANNDYTEKFYASTNTQLTEGSSRGLYGITKTSDKQLYADFLVSINKNFGEDWNLSANIGGSFTVVLSELMPNLNKDYLSYLKLRGSFASVGSAFQRYLANPRYEWSTSANQWSVLTQYPMYSLKPDRTNSF